MAETDIETISWDFAGMLAHAAGGKPEDWTEMDGPESGSGLDYWYRNEKTGAEAYINLDQTTVSISVDDEGVLQFDLDEAAADDPVRKFVTQAKSAPAGP